MKLNNRIFLMLGMASMFSLNNFAAMAAKGCAGIAAGKYCFTEDDKVNCPGGCFCVSMANVDAVKNISGLGNKTAVKNACGNHYTGVRQQLQDRGVYYCPSEWPLSDPQAKGEYDCYKKKSTGNGKLHYKIKHCDAGTYLPKDTDANGSCKQCTRTNYCEGGDFYPSAKQDLGIKKCPNGYTSNKGATSVTKCYQTNANGTNTFYTPETPQNNNNGSVNNFSGTTKTPGGSNSPAIFTEGGNNNNNNNNNNSYQEAVLPNNFSQQEPYTITPHDPEDYRTCNDGYYWKGSSKSCAMCKAGFYCLSASYSTDLSSDSGLNPCADGYYSGTGASQCTKCATGETSNENHTGCIPDNNNGNDDPEGPTSKYTVKYYTGTCAGSSNALIHTDTDGAIFGENYTVPEGATEYMNDNINSGYTFMGWNTASGKLISNFPGSSENPWSRTSDLNVYAACKQSSTQTKFKVEYDCGDGDGEAPIDSTEYLSGTSVQTRQNSCEAPENSVFKQWKCGNTPVNALGTFTISSNTVCRAIYDEMPDPVDTCNVKYDCNNNNPNQIYNETEEDSFTLKAEGACTKPANNQVFDGWKLNLTGEVFEGGAGDMQCVQSNMIFTAQWRGQTSNDITCSATRYLPKNKAVCEDCTAGNKCPGGTYQKNQPNDQGIFPCSGTNEYSGVRAAQCSQCQNGANEDHTGCIDDADDNTETIPFLVTVGPGYYLRAGESTPSECAPVGDLDTDEFCPGGQFLSGQSTWQGIYRCPDNGVANTSRTACKLYLSKDRLQYGFAGQDCWLETTKSGYEDCVFTGTYKP